MSRTVVIYGLQQFYFVMKINRHGQESVFTQSEIQLIFTHGLADDPDRTLFGVCLFTAARIREFKCDFFHIHLNQHKLGFLCLHSP